MITLNEWQEIVKPKEEILYNCSEFKYLNDEWVHFPIGMGYTFNNYNGDLKNVQIGTHANLVLCSINSQTDQRRRPHPKNRSSILATLSSNNIHNTYLNSNIYFNTLPSYKFIISPEGNGIDCHRHYEALMAGCIPIVEEHSGIREKYGNCPILYTNDYSEISETYLEYKYKEMLETKYDFSKLLLSNYNDTTKSEIISNGNYWGERLTGKKWYSNI
jgi:hypothetical protein